MQTLDSWPIADRRAITGVLTDIDDTLTTNGAITADALAALYALKAAGLPVIAVTGRPVGWSEPFARDWPVAAIVAENGAVALFRSPVRPEPLDTEAQTASQHGSGGREQLLKLYQQGEAERHENFARMQQVSARVLRDVPGAQLARDSAGRETDIAIDHSEFTSLTGEQIAHTLDLMRSEGLNATVSSIHVNGWIGSHNKLQGATWAVRELLGRNLDAERKQWVWIGDSTNDELLFEAIPNSIGVANVRRFEAQLTHRPRYVAQAERGAGFAEAVKALLEAQISLGTLCTTPRRLS